MTNEPGRPAPLSRSVLERVLARAAELSAQSSDDEPGLTEAQLVEIAGEAGLSRDVVRQALAEERASVPMGRDSGMARSLLGEAVVEAARTVPGDAAGTLAMVNTWMERAESLTVMRRQPGQMTWEPRQDFVSAMRRALHLGGRGFHLAAATEVCAVVAPVEARRVHVRLLANLRGARARAAGVAVGVATAGVLVGVPAFWMATSAGLMLAATLAMVPAVAIPLAAITIARNRFRSQRIRAQVALEQVLDGLEYGDGPPHG